MLTSKVPILNINIRHHIVFIRADFFLSEKQCTDSDCQAEIPGNIKVMISSVVLGKSADRSENV